MKLLNDFFDLILIRITENKFHVEVELNPDHEIFLGHFPGKPVVPGVCMVQMLKEVLTCYYNKEFTMKEASQLKFLAILNPNEVKSLSIQFTVVKRENDCMVVTGTFQKDELIYMKFKGTFVAIANEKRPMQSIKNLLE